MRAVSLIRVSPADQFFYNPQNILRLITKKEKNNWTVITNTSNLYRINLDCFNITQRKKDKKMRYYNKKIETSLSNLQKINSKIDIIRWDYLERFSNFQKNNRIIRNDKILFPQILDYTENTLLNISDLLCKEMPDRKTILHGTNNLIREFSVMMSIRETLNIDRCTILYPKEIPIFTDFINHYQLDWLNTKSLD